MCVLILNRSFIWDGVVGAEGSGDGAHEGAVEGMGDFQPLAIPRAVQDERGGGVGRILLRPSLEEN